MRLSGPLEELIPVHVQRQESVFAFMDGDLKGCADWRPPSQANGAVVVHRRQYSRRRFSPANRKRAR